ncbi:hypothetical protein OZX57_03460 [Bifidobacterium sp. ESL0682]|uniref:hypothetical protein n=1 Tax=Bifidobacterium sp. ESL0682 TaxID=2983212 RepID=UPI0023F78BD3|nr:hypothetical protein [Bifidobacterium sp. ESL0682]WEV42503.1 hypothetical protein OZX57_03460 [Bifidobacterium sp. ESL0682]
MKLKKMAVVVVSWVMLLGFAACGASSQSDASKGASSSQTRPATKPANLIGTWKQTNSSSKDEMMEATVTVDSIEINWVKPDQKSLYWKGTFTAPTKAGAYSWTSQGDTETMKKSIMASQDATKKFTYDGKQLTYAQSALGTTSTIRMSKQ